MHADWTLQLRFAFVLGAQVSDISHVPGTANRFRSFVFVGLNYVARYASVVLVERIMARR